MNTVRVTSQAPLAPASPTPVAPAVSAAPAAHPEAPSVVQDQVSVGAVPSEPEAPPAPAASAAPAPAPTALPEPPSTLLMEAPAVFEEVPGVPGMAVATVDAREMASPQARQILGSEMLQYLQAWPSTTAVVTVAPGASQSEVMVASRPDAVAQAKLQGVYQVVQHLASSDSIKEAARAYPCEFRAVKAENAEGTLHSLRLPGPQTAETVSTALAEGGRPMQFEQVRRLIHNLPPGRIALLVPGPSAAGKSGVAKQIGEFAREVGRQTVDLMGDMYFKDVDQAGNPTTPAGAPYWDHVDFMDLEKLKNDIGELVGHGSAETPVYNFQDVRPGGWRMPTNLTGFREEKPKPMTMGENDILVLDSLHAANGEIIEHLESMGLPHATLYLDSPSADDRILRRLVRDYETRGGRMPEVSMELWDQTTWPGEKDFVRPTILQLDPAQDVFLITRFPKDLGLDRAQLDQRSAEMAEYGLAPSYEAYGAKAEDLPALAKREETRLASLVADEKAEPKDRSRARVALDRIRKAPKHQA